MAVAMSYARVVTDRGPPGARWSPGTIDTWRRRSTATPSSRRLSGESEHDWLLMVSSDRPEPEDSLQLCRSKLKRSFVTGSTTVATSVRSSSSPQRIRISPTSSPVS